jgi:nucleolar protein 12
VEEAELSASSPDSPAANGAEAEEPNSDADSDDVETPKASSRHKTSTEASQRSRKRKRGDPDDNLEQLYMERLAREEEKYALKTSKVAKVAEIDHGDESSSVEETDTEDQDAVVDEADSTAEPFSRPQHESQTEENTEIKKASRTVFLGNVSTQAIVSKTAKKELLRHLASFLPSLPVVGIEHTVESIRFRSTAYSTKLPKKAAFAKKDLTEATTKSTNAYAVYSTNLAAREAVKQLNGMVILDRHIHVDQVAHPTKTDHRRCVFVGNLDFVDDDSQIREANEHGEERKRKKNKVPGDVEEGLWRQFGKAGTVESIRVPRDPKTRVGKGFAYVQFVVSNFYAAVVQGAGLTRVARMRMG